MASEQDWTAVPANVVDHVATLLLNRDITDFIRLRAVCRAWRSSTAEADPKIQPLSFRPRNWIMLYESDSPLTIPTPFLNISTGKFALINIPELGGGDGGGHELIRCNDGLLLLEETTTSNLSLSNPFTGSSLGLPPFDTIHTQSYDLSFMLFLSHQLRVHITSSNLVLLCFAGMAAVAVAKPGDQCWVYVELNLGPCATLFFRDRLYALTRNGGLVRIDIEPKPDMSYETKVVSLIPLEREFVEEHTCLVESDDEMLLVHRLHFSCDCHVFKVDLSEKKFIPIENIGDRALFVAEYRSLSISTKDFPSIKANCIYFPYKGQVGVYHIGDHRIECGYDFISLDDCQNFVGPLQLANCLVIYCWNLKQMLSYL